MIRLSRVAWLGSLVLLVAPAASAAGSRADLLALRANQALGLTRSEVTTVEFAPTDGGGIRADFQLDGEAVRAALAPRSVRSPDFQLLAQAPDGRLVPVSPSPAATLRGVLEGKAGSIVAGSMLDEGLFALVTIGGLEYWMQPLARHAAEATPADYVIYREEDVICANRPCGGELVPGPGPTTMVPPPPSGVSTKGTVIKVAQLACDADFEYFSQWGSVSAVQTRIESVINTMNAQYENECGITHDITTIIVRTSSSQPYTSTDPNTLLNQFRAHWNANQAGVQRDVAELFTGKELNGGVIGIAWVGVVCNLSFAYSVVQSDFSGAFQCVTDLSAHEIGHNWSAQHCSCTSYTMNPFITCANTHHPTLSIPPIVNYRNSVSCLADSGGGGGNPTSIHVGAITPSSLSAKGSKKASVTVRVVNDLGAPVAGATVTGTLSGDVTGTLSGTTGSDGNVTLNSAGSKKGSFHYTFCVTGVSGALPYQSADNAETCDGL